MVWKDWWSFDVSQEAIQPDGKMIIASALYWGDSVTLMRFTQGGLIDTTFNHVGYRTYYCGFYPGISGLGITESGKIVLSGISFDEAGKYKILMMSFLPDGTPDSSFNHTGLLHTDLGF